MSELSTLFNAFAACFFDSVDFGSCMLPDLFADATFLFDNASFVDTEILGNCFIGYRKFEQTEEHPVVIILFFCKGTSVFKSKNKMPGHKKQDSCAIDFRELTKRKYWRFISKIILHKFCRPKE